MIDRMRMPVSLGGMMLYRLLLLREKLVVVLHIRILRLHDHTERVRHECTLASLATDLNRSHRAHRLVFHLSVAEHLGVRVSRVRVGRRLPLLSLADWRWVYRRVLQRPVIPIISHSAF